MFDRLTTLNTKENVIDIINVVLGVCLALAPWALDFAAEATAAWNAWITGAAIALVAFTQLEEWINLALGVWAGIAPWAIAFSENAAATGVHAAIGIAVAVLAAARLWFVHRNPPRVTA
ncbi:MAG TPA: SPW repeat protein [Hyphomicrobium sp.]|nr:SPW repeat protein [Hyphomicrobium sp.]